MPISAVYFDIGETLVDRTREYAAIARQLGTSPNTFSAVLGAMIVAGKGVDDALARFGVDRETAHNLAAVPIEEVDLYPDARECLQQLRAAGLRVGIVGNQPSGVADELRALDLATDLIATSAEWGVSKPDPSFFTKIIEDAQADPRDIVYVGDQINNDVHAPIRAGLQTVRIRRGPWGALVHDAAAEAQCLAVIDHLDELTTLLTRSGG